MQSNELPGKNNLPPLINGPFFEYAYCFHKKQCVGLFAHPFKQASMKKLVIALIVLGFTLPSFAGIKVKDVVGTWSYKIEIDYETLSGKLVFEKEGEGLSGKVLTDDGQTFVMSKVEIRDNNVLYFEMEIEYTLMEAHFTIDGKKYSGTYGNEGGTVTVTGEKLD